MTQSSARTAPSRDRRTKIVATLGPASHDRATLARLIDAGVDVARLNASHGTQAEHAQRIRLVRSLERRLRRPIGVMLDLQGPKLRIGALEGGGPVRLVPGRRVVIEAGHFAGTAERIATSYPRLARDVSRGDRILLDDGRMRLRVVRTRGGRVEAEIEVGGLLREHKGINLPGVAIGVPSLTPKDRRDLSFGIGAGVDLVALSFVRRASDLLALRRAIARRGGKVLVVAKIEKPEGVERIDEILEHADGIMVARGDLGVELAPERVPAVQKALIAKANERDRIVITATQMLESMVSSPLPTRAEASDVANAIFDGTDAVMLSAETASGRYPVEAVRMMAAIAREAESHGAYVALRRSDRPRATQAHALARAACYAAREAFVDTIVVLTISGRTALTISKMKPEARIIAITPSVDTARKMALYRGVRPLVAPFARRTAHMIANAERVIRRAGAVAKGDAVILVAGTTSSVGATNMIKLHTVGRRD
jgi:pyruvate kinase